MELGGGPDDGDDGRGFMGSATRWDQDTLGIAGPLDDVPFDDLEQRFINVVKVQPRSATARAKSCLTR